MTEKSHILVVDDDKRVRTLLQRYLTDEGFRVSLAEDGAAMRQILADGPADLILLDLVLPGEDGLALARKIRMTSETPIIMLTGKGKMVDRVIGLEMGADDYIAKPFHLREVLARIRTVLRRAPVAPKGVADAVDPAAEVLRFGGRSLDLTKREFRDADGTVVSLTAAEFDLLAVFVGHPNRPLDRDRLMDLARNQDWTPYDRAIDTQVARLRKKIEPNPSEPQFIKTVRGVGYVFSAKMEG